MTTLLEVSAVSVSFDGFRAINNLSIQIAEPTSPACQRPIKPSRIASRASHPVAIPQDVSDQKKPRSCDQAPAARPLRATMPLGRN